MFTASAVLAKLIVVMVIAMRLWMVILKLVPAVPLIVELVRRLKKPMADIATKMRNAHREIARITVAA